MKLAKLFGLGMAAVAAASVALAPSAQALTQEIILGESQTTVQPPATLELGEDLMFHVVNTQAEPVTLNVPALNAAFVVPANSERIFYADVPPGMIGQISYSVESQSGELLASGAIQQDTELVALIQRNERATIVYAPDPEPEYYTTTPVQRREAVRGYW